jgi:hypothetical protein
MAGPLPFATVTAPKKVRHSFQKRFVSVLSFWCLTRHKPLKKHEGATPAGFAKTYNRKAQ